MIFILIDKIKVYIIQSHTVVIIIQLYINLLTSLINHFYKESGIFYFNRNN